MQQRRLNVMEVCDEAKHNARFKEKGCDKPLSKANNQVQ